MDLGFGGLIDKFEEYLGKRATFVLLTVVGLALFSLALKVIVESLIWLGRIIGAGGEYIGILTSANWVDLTYTFLLIVVSIALGDAWVGKRIKIRMEKQRRELYEMSDKSKKYREEARQSLKRAEEVVDLAETTLAKAYKLMDEIEDRKQ